MKKQSRTITHEDVQRALASFRKNGGAITRLPDQAQPSLGPIGEKYGIWESGLAVLGFGEDRAPEAGAFQVAAKA